MTAISEDIPIKTGLVKDYIDSFFTDKQIDDEAFILSDDNDLAITESIYAPPVDNFSTVMECSVSGRKFCVSIVRLISVIRAENYSLGLGLNYYIGDINHAGIKYNVIDLGVKVRDKNVSLQDGSGYIILCDNGMALFCDKIIENRKIDYTFVTWRSRRHKTPWNSGIDNGSTMVIDVDELHVLK